MPINVFGNSNSNDNGNKIDTSLFVKKPYLRTIYIESNIEEDIDLRNQYGNKNIPDPISYNSFCIMSIHIIVSIPKYKYSYNCKYLCFKWIM